MGLFSIDIEKYYNEQASIGNNLLGLFSLQYPIYCIHANILDRTSDPLDSLDKVIVDFIHTKNDISVLQISYLLGTSKAIINQRIGILIDDNLLERTAEGLKLTAKGLDVFKERTITRQHKRSIDFYIDGLTLEPLPDVFYGHYRFKYISEYDSYFRTRPDGKEIIEKPFGPDLIHSAPDKNVIINKIMNIANDTRIKFKIPVGLESIEDLTYTKMSIYLMVSVTKNGESICKTLIDPHAFYIISSPLSYSETLELNAKVFLPQLENKINNLVFKLFTPTKRNIENKDPQPVLKSNWAEIDKYNDSKNECFNFVKDDVVKALENMYGIKSIDEQSIINAPNRLEINIDKRTLVESSNKGKLINDLIRKRDYKFGNPENNVFLMFIYYNTNDPYVLEVIRFKNMVQTARNNEGVNANWVKTKIPDLKLSFRELCVSSGELDLLEKIDISNHMTSFK